MDNVDFSKDIRDYSGLELAFFRRCYLGTGNKKILLTILAIIFPLLNKYVKAKVNARYQSLIYKKIINDFR